MRKGDEIARLSSNGGSLLGDGSLLGGDSLLCSSSLVRSTMTKC